MKSIIICTLVTRDYLLLQLLPITTNNIIFIILWILLLSAVIRIDNARYRNCLLRLMTGRGSTETVHTHLVLFSQEWANQLVHVERLLLEETWGEAWLSQGYLLVRLLRGGRGRWLASRHQVTSLTSSRWTTHLTWLEQFRRANTLGVGASWLVHRLLVLLNASVVVQVLVARLVTQQDVRGWLTTIVL